MAVCVSCGSRGAGDDETFCPDCGQRVAAVNPPTAREDTDLSGLLRSASVPARMVADNREFGPSWDANPVARRALIAVAVTLLAAVAAYALFGGTTPRSVLDPETIALNSATADPAVTDSSGAGGVPAPPRPSDAGAIAATKIAPASPAGAQRPAVSATPTRTSTAPTATPLATAAAGVATRVGPHPPPSAYTRQPTPKPTATRRPTPTPTPSPTRSCLVRDAKTHLCLDHSQD
jgi:hypothetical protein